MIKSNKFFESNDFYYILNKIIEDKTLLHITDNHFLKNKKCCVSREEFFLVFDSIFENFSSKTENLSNFNFEYIIYKGLRFEIMYGQCTIHSIIKTPELYKFILQKSIDSF